MITVRIWENQVKPIVELKCPNCGGQKEKFKLSEEQMDNLLYGESIKLVCPKCLDGFNLELSY